MKTCPFVCLCAPCQIEAWSALFWEMRLNWRKFNNRQLRDFTVAMQFKA